MTSENAEVNRFLFVTGGEVGTIHIGRIDTGASGEVHEVHIPDNLQLTHEIAPQYFEWRGTTHRKKVVSSSLYRFLQGS